MVLTEFTQMPAFDGNIISVDMTVAPIFYQQGQQKINLINEKTDVIYLLYIYRF